MDIENIGDNMVVAAGIDNGTGPVHGFGHLINQTEHRVILLAAIQVPGFVKGAPADYSRMIEITRHNFHPFSQELFQSFSAARRVKIKTPAGMFAPDQIAEMISPVKKTFFKNFLVQPGAIEAQLHGKLNVAS